MKTWRDIEELADREILLRLVEEQCTPTRIARRIGCSLASVRTAMKFYGLKAKKYRIGEEMKTILDL